MTSQALIDACREIYRTHKSAFDLVMEHGQQSLLAQAFEEFMREHPQLTATATRSETVFFLHKDWLLISGAQVADRRRWSTPFPVQFWFQLGEKKLQLRLEIGPVISDLTASRVELVQRFRAEYLTNGSKVSPTYTRVLTTSGKLPEDPTLDDVLAAMNELWAKWEANHGGPQRVKQIVSDWANRPTSEPI